MITAVSGASTSTLLSRLAKKMSRSAQEEELGMRPRHFWVLSFLSDHDGVPQHELGDAFMLDANNAVLLLNELETAGYIERRRNPKDRRFRKLWNDFQFQQLHDRQSPPAELDEPVILPFVRRAVLPDVPQAPKLPGRRIRLDRGSASKPHLPRPAWKPDTKHAP